MVFGIASDGFQVWLGGPPFGAHHEFAELWFCVVWLAPTVGLAAALHHADEQSLHLRHRRPAGNRPASPGA